MYNFTKDEEFITMWSKTVRTIRDKVFSAKGLDGHYVFSKETTQQLPDLLEVEGKKDAASNLGKLKLNENFYLVINKDCGYLDGFIYKNNLLLFKNCYPLNPEKPAGKAPGFNDPKVETAVKQAYESVTCSQHTGAYPMAKIPDPYFCKPNEILSLINGALSVPDALDRLGEDNVGILYPALFFEAARSDFLEATLLYHFVNNITTESYAVPCEVLMDIGRIHWSSGDGVFRGSAINTQTVHSLALSCALLGSDSALTLIVSLAEIQCDKSMLDTDKELAKNRACIAFADSMMAKRTRLADSPTDNGKTNLITIFAKTEIICADALYKIIHSKSSFLQYLTKTKVNNDIIFNRLSDLYIACYDNVLVTKRGIIKEASLNKLATVNDDSLHKTKVITKLNIWDTEEYRDALKEEKIKPLTQMKQIITRTAEPVQKLVA